MVHQQKVVTLSVYKMYDRMFHEVGLKAFVLLYLNIKMTRNVTMFHSFLAFASMSCELMQHAKQLYIWYNIYTEHVWGSFMLH